MCFTFPKTGSTSTAPVVTSMVTSEHAAPYAKYKNGRPSRRSRFQLILGVA